MDIGTDWEVWENKRAVEAVHRLRDDSYSGDIETFEISRQKMMDIIELANAHSRLYCGLLEACKLALNHGKSFDIFRDDVGQFIESQIKQAIAKAEGKI